MMRELDIYEMECVSGGQKGLQPQPPGGGLQGPPPTGSGHVFTAATVVQGVHQGVTIVQAGGHITIGG